MSYRTFNHLFLPLMVLSAISAFFIPVEYTNFCRGRVDGIFSPIATPLRRLNDGRDLGGELRNFSRPFKVLSPDLAGRDSLNIHATTGDGVIVGMPVVCQQGLVGKISTVGNLGAQVRLITDIGSRISGQFGKFQLQPDGNTNFAPITTNEPLVEGRGHGLMAITNITMKEVADSKLLSGDWLVLNDRDMWPATVNGQRLGQIVSINKTSKSTLHAEIQLRPLVNLDTLREVMVVTGQQHIAPPPAKPNPE